MLVNVEMELMVQLLASDRCGRIGVTVAADADLTTTGDERLPEAAP